MSPMASVDRAGPLRDMRARVATAARKGWGQSPSWTDREIQFRSIDMTSPVLLSNRCKPRPHSRHRTRRLYAWMSQAWRRQASLLAKNDR